MESNYSGRLSHVSSQPAMIPSSRSLLSRDKSCRLTHGIQLSPSRWFGGHVQDLFSKLQDRCVVPSPVVSFRPCRCRTWSSSMPQTPPTSTMSLRRRDSGPLAVLQCTLQCPGLAGNEAHRTLDDPIGLSFSHWRSLWHSLTPFLAGLCNLSRQDRIAGSSVVPELIDELRCSLCDPGKLSPFSRNQQSPRHLVCGLMQRVSPKLLPRTSTSFRYWIFGVSANVKYGCL